MKHRVLIGFDLDIQRRIGADFTPQNLMDSVHELIRRTFPAQFAVAARKGALVVPGADGKPAQPDVLIRVLQTTALYVPHDWKPGDPTTQGGTKEVAIPEPAPAPAEGEPREMRFEAEARVPELPKPGLSTPIA